jgi:hypothetical protein
MTRGCATLRADVHNTLVLVAVRGRGFAIPRQQLAFMKHRLPHRPLPKYRRHHRLIAPLLVVRLNEGIANGLTASHFKKEILK